MVEKREEKNYPVVATAKILEVHDLASKDLKVLTVYVGGSNTIPVFLPKSFNLSDLKGFQLTTYKGFLKLIPIK